MHIQELCVQLAGLEWAYAHTQYEITTIDRPNCLFDVDGSTVQFDRTKYTRLITLNQLLIRTHQNEDKQNESSSKGRKMRSMIE